MIESSASPWRTGEADVRAALATFRSAPRVSWFDARDVCRRCEQPPAGGGSAGGGTFASTSVYGPRTRLSALAPKVSALAVSLLALHFSGAAHALGPVCGIFAVSERRIIERYDGIPTANHVSC